jgi:AhpD family alkylhydroperoxidase
MGHFHDRLRELGPPTRELRKRIPDTYGGFLQMAQGAVADGDIPGRIKEAMAVAIAVTHGCEECIAHHAKAAARLGTTEQELAEALGVALLMAGGPASTMAPTAWRAFQEFREDLAPAAS